MCRINGNPSQVSRNGDALKERRSRIRRMTADWIDGAAHLSLAMPDVDGRWRIHRVISIVYARLPLSLSKLSFVFP